MRFANEGDPPGVGTVAPVAEDVWRIVLPTPWPVGPVNVYLIDDEPLTLFDTGQLDAPALAALEAGLAACGRRVEDLERIVLSHQHIDHWGMAGRLAERSGAEVCALREFSSWLVDYPESLELEDRFAEQLLERHGIGLDAPAAGVYRGHADFGASLPVIAPLRDGEVMEFSRRRLRVLHRPGHSPSDTVLYDERRRLMIGADHVMARPSVPILSPPLVRDGERGGERPRALADYRSSLLATATLDVDLILPGHGNLVRSPHGVIAERLRRYDAMTERIRLAVEPEPRPAIEIASSARGRVVDATAFFVLCDTLGYLDELLDAGGVVESDEDGVAMFAAA
jgi:glyoxylase-like metal-dependent hydrolase (beta-lactamase superfamily II)